MLGKKSFLLPFGALLFCFLHLHDGKVQNRTVFNATQAPDPFHSELKQSMEEFIAGSMGTREAPPGLAVCVVKDGHVVLLRGFGNKRVDIEEQVDVHTAFRLASLSKSFAAFLTSILAQEGYLHWDDRVKKHWPDFTLKSTRAADSLRIRHILSQTTGFPRHAFTNLIEEGYSHQELVESLQEIDPIAMPGSLYSYQNVAYSLIEPVLQKVTGKSYDALLREKVFSPLHMYDASTNLNDLLQKGNFASPHLPYSRGWRSIGASERYYNVISAGGINASVSDMAKYFLALTRGRPSLSVENVEMLFEPEVRSHIRYKYFSKWPDVRKVYYGLGWRILDLGSDKPVVAYHGGYVNGYRNSMALIPEERAAICVLTNSSSGFADDCVRHFVQEHARLARFVPLVSAPSLPLKMWFWPV
jgi:beta-lactamase class C